MKQHVNDNDWPPENLSETKKIIVFNLFKTEK